MSNVKRQVSEAAGTAVGRVLKFVFRACVSVMLSAAVSQVSWQNMRFQPKPECGAWRNPQYVCPKPPFPVKSSGLVSVGRMTLKQYELESAKR